MARDDDELLTLAEVAKELKVAPRTVRRWVETGDFPHPMKFGETIRWRYGAVRQHFADVEEAAAMEDWHAAGEKTSDMSGQSRTSEDTGDLPPSGKRKGV